MRCSQPSRPEWRLLALRDYSESPSPMCEKCWRQNLDDLEKADNLVLWMSHSDDESGGQEFESLRARQLAHCRHICFVQCVGSCFHARRAVEARWTRERSLLATLIENSARDGRRWHGLGQAVSGLYAGGRRDWQLHKRLCEAVFPNGLSPKRSACRFGRRSAQAPEGYTGPPANKGGVR
jgi:hypothetical protein